MGDSRSPAIVGSGGDRSIQGLSTRAPMAATKVPDGPPVEDVRRATHEQRAGVEATGTGKRGGYTASLTRSSSPRG